MKESRWCYKKLDYSGNTRNMLYVDEQAIKMKIIIIIIIIIIIN